MAKKRKTKEQKKLADLRHSFSHTTIANQPVFTVKTDTIKKEIKPSPAKIQSSSSKETYPFLIKDISKTGILTAAILGFQVILYFLLTKHSLKIPGLIY
ncbi:MAG TPA: hypothetical protein VES68_00140 [Candidatus Sulfotelmatobacter sp.]|nr:hypothetical protein [Candidatus Sulfotelmatobacter sp.]